MKRTEHALTTCFLSPAKVILWNPCSPSAIQALESKHPHKSCKEVHCKIKSQSKVPLQDPQVDQKSCCCLRSLPRALSWSWADAYGYGDSHNDFSLGIFKITLLPFGVFTALFQMTKNHLVCLILSVVLVKEGNKIFNSPTVLKSLFKVVFTMFCFY